MSTEKPWDVSYEWKAILTMSLAFGLVGIDRFILPPLFPAMMKDLHAHLSGSRQSGRRTRRCMGRLGHCHRAACPIVSGRRSILVPAVVIFSLLSVLSGMATGPGEPAGHPRHHGRLRRAGRLDRGRGCRRGLAPQAAGHEQRHLPVHRFAVRQRRRPDPRDPAAADHDLAPCVLDRGPPGSGDRGHPLVRDPRTGDARRPARHALVARASSGRCSSTATCRWPW